MTKKIFKRKVYDRLLRWKEERGGRTAVLLQGARRIGKSTIVEEFAKREYRSYIFIDFNRAPSEVLELFDDLTDLNFLFLNLQNAYSTALYVGESLIVFDEVQRCPRARQAIKYLVADGRYHYIETGSLISIKQNVKDITIPSEEVRIDMFPMDYEEFRWAMGDTAFSSIMPQFLHSKQSIGAAHRKQMRNLRLYMLVGGMPQAVSEFLDTNNLSCVDVVKREIVNLYLDDLRKTDTSGRMSKLFMSIPSQLNRNIARYYPKTVIGQADEDLRHELRWGLEDSCTTLACYHADDPNVGMPLARNLGRYKLYVADTGLFVTMAFWDKDYTENIIYQKLLTDKLSANLGYVYENLVAQMLVAGGNRLFYYTFPKDDKHRYEVDFLLSRGNKLCPIEVKSSGYNSHASLDAFCDKFSAVVDKRYLIYTKDLRKDADTLLLPVYMTPFI